MATGSVSPADGATDTPDVSGQSFHRHRAASDGPDRNRLGLLWVFAAVGLGVLIFGTRFLIRGLFRRIWLRSRARRREKALRHLLPR